MISKAPSTAEGATPSAPSSSLFAAVSSAFNAPQLTLGGSPDHHTEHTASTNISAANAIATSLYVKVHFGTSSNPIGTGLQVYGEETFTTDRLILGVQALSPTWLQPRGLGSVNMQATPPNMLNAAERDSMVACVEQFLESTPARQTSSIKVNVVGENAHQSTCLRAPHPQPTAHKLPGSGFMLT